MKTELYWAAVALLASASAISHYATVNPAAYNPGAPGPFNVLSGIATVGWLAAVVGGFFVFRWYDPLVGIAIGFVVVLPLRALALRSGLYPGVTMLIALLGIGCGIALFLV